jgi:hypothetical protein
MAWARKLGVEERELDAYDPLCGTVIATDAGDIDLTPRTAIGRAVLSRTDARVIPRSVFDSAHTSIVSRAVSFTRPASTFHT